MSEIWRRNRPSLWQIRHVDERRLTRDCVVEIIPPGSRRLGGPVTTSTGLGLPLCRSFALAGGGWVNVEDSSTLDGPVPPALTHIQVDADGTDVEAVTLDNLMHHEGGVTQFWAVMKVERVAATDPGAASTGTQSSAYTRSSPVGAKMVTADSTLASTAVPSRRHALRCVRRVCMCVCVCVCVRAELVCDAAVHPSRWRFLYAVLEVP